MCGASDARKPMNRNAGGSRHSQLRRGENVSGLAASTGERKVPELKISRGAVEERVGAIPATRVRFAMKQAGNRVGVVPTVSVD